MCINETKNKAKTYQANTTGVKEAKHEQTRLLEPPPASNWARGAESVMPHAPHTTVILKTIPSGRDWVLFSEGTR